MATNTPDKTATAEETVKLLHDQTLVWMTHPDVEVAAQYPRSFRVVDPSWTEVKDPEKDQKVALAIKSGLNDLVRPAAETIKEK